MTRTRRPVRPPWQLLALMLVAGATPQATFGQTPAQMEYDRQQREYWRQQEQQRQEQQRVQQTMQDNARRQQEEANRINAPSNQSSGGTSSATGSGRGGDPTGAQAASAARATWEKRPVLPADRNPILGKWQRPPSTRPNPADPFGAIQAMAKGGLCEVLFGGGGVFEFRTDKLVGMDARTPEQELDRVEYRGDAKHVVVLPKTTLKLIEFDVEGPNRISWTGQNCVLVRTVAATMGGTDTAPAKPANAARAATASSPQSNSGGVLTLSVGAPSPGNNVTGRKLWVLKTDPQFALIKAGVVSTPDATVLQNWMRACLKKDPLCAKGAQALQAYSVGMATTDADGRAKTPPLPAGRYWVLSDAKIDNRRMLWNQPVDVKGAETLLTLDQRNSMPVE